MSSTDGCAIFRWIIGVGLDQKKIKIKKIEKNLSVLLRYNLKLIVPCDCETSNFAMVVPLQLCLVLVVFIITVLQISHQCQS